MVWGQSCKSVWHVMTNLHLARREAMQMETACGLKTRATVLVLEGHAMMGQHPERCGRCLDATYRVGDGERRANRKS